jgi:hypothetical protein
MKLIFTQSVWMATALTALLAATAQAADDTRRDERRENAQEARIVQGVASGELTRTETRRLMAQQRRVDRAQRAATADGAVGPREAAALERQQDRGSRLIARQKHDAQQRPSR